HATLTRTVACTGPSIDLIQVWMWSYPTSEAVITGSFSITGMLVRTSVPTASLYVISSKVATPQGDSPVGKRGENGAPAEQEPTGEERPKEPEQTKIRADGHVGQYRTQQDRNTVDYGGHRASLLE